MTTVDEVRIVSQDRPRDMAVQVKFLIPGWPGDAHLLSNLLQRLCGRVGLRGLLSTGKFIEICTDFEGL